MKDFDRNVRDSVIEFASVLYGACWRTRLAEKVGMTKRALEHAITCGHPLPRKLSLCALREMQTHLDAQRAERDAMTDRIAALRNGIGTQDASALSSNEYAAGPGASSSDRSVYQRRKPRPRGKLRLVASKDASSE